MTENQSNILVKDLVDIIHEYKQKKNVFDLIEKFNDNIKKILINYTNEDINQDINENINNGLNNMETNKVIHELEKHYYYNNLICRFFICYKLSLSVIICCEIFMNIDDFSYLINKGAWIRNFIRKNNQNTLSFLDVFEEMKKILIKGYSF